MKTTYIWICGFGKPHELTEQCECVAKYNMSTALFETKLEKLYPKKTARNLTHSEFMTIINPFTQYFIDSTYDR